MDDLRLQGIAHFNAGRFEEAAAGFRAAIAGGDHGPEPRIMLAHALVAAYRPEEAAAQFVSALKEFPRHQPAYEGLASLLLRRGDLSGGCAALRGALALSARGELRLPLVRTLRLCALAWRVCGDLDAAQRALDRARRLSPGDAEGRRLLLEILRERAQPHIAANDFAPAEKALRRALAVDTRDKESRSRLIAACHRRGLAQVAAGRLDEAERTYRRALALAPRDRTSRRRLLEVVRMRGQAHLTKGELVKAERSLRAALALTTRGEALRRQLAGIAARRGRELLSDGRLEPGRAALRRALAVHPRGPASRGSFIALLRLCADAWTAAGRSDQAERSLRRALALSPADAGVRQDLAALLRARTIARDIPNMRVRRRRERRAWEAVVKLDPRDGAALISLSLLLRWTGRPTEERAALRRAVSKGCDLSRADRFKALMRLGRFPQALRVAEGTLDSGLSLTDFRAFIDPWEKDNRPDREAPQTDLGALERALRPVPGPWREFYLGSLGGPEDLRHFDALPRGARYRWMHYNAAMGALFSGNFSLAVRWFDIALKDPGMDWRARGYLAEAYACLDRPAPARREMARGLTASPENERAQVYAWWGELELWLGDYPRALELTTRACAMGAPFAHGWRGAALLKLGRKAEALAQLDAALILYPKDSEALLWRAEAKRELGRPREALADLESVAHQHMVWVRINRALSHRALGDESAMRSDFDLLPPAVTEHVRRRLGLRAEGALDAGAIARVLEEGLALGRGFRRAEYGQAVWLSRRHG